MNNEVERQGDRGRGAVQSGRQAGLGGMVVALVVKYILTAVVAWIAFGLLTRNSWAQILTLALVVTLVNYLIADMLVFRVAGNVVAAVVDGAVAAFLAWLMTMGLLVRAMTVTTTALGVFGVLVAVGEYFFHLYLPKPEKVGP